MVVGEAEIARAIHHLEVGDAGAVVGWSEKKRFDLRDLTRVGVRDFDVPV